LICRIGKFLHRTGGFDHTTFNQQFPDLSEIFLIERAITDHPVFDKLSPVVDANKSARGRASYEMSTPGCRSGAPAAKKMVDV